MAEEKISDVDFVKAWESCENAEELAKKLGKDSTKGLGVRASALRKKGIPLKDYPKKVVVVKKEIDKDELLGVLAKIRKTTPSKLEKEGEALAKKLIAEAKERKANKD